MMDRTDRHYRYMMRLISQKTLLYTEMITVKAILNGDRHRLLSFHPSEHPIALQVGGDDPDELAAVASIAESWGYDEININVGCPSSRVQSGRFGACLMKRPDVVAEGVRRMKDSCAIPVTVKHRIGVDELDSYGDMKNFIDCVSSSKADRFSIHARKAWLQGLSPKENRNIPPLRYEEVYQLKRERSDLSIEINGGIKSYEQMDEHLKHVDAVMLGRAAYDNPWLFSQVDHRYFGAPKKDINRADVAALMLPYIEQHLQAGGKMMSVTRHMLNLFKGVPGGRRWRRELGTLSAKGQSDIEAVERLILSFKEGGSFIREGIR